MIFLLYVLQVSRCDFHIIYTARITVVIFLLYVLQDPRNVFHIICTAGSQ